MRKGQLKLAGKGFDPAVGLPTLMQTKLRGRGGGGVARADCHCQESPACTCNKVSQCFYSYHVAITARKAQ